MTQMTTNQYLPQTEKTAIYENVTEKLKHFFNVIIVLLLNKQETTKIRLCDKRNTLL